MDSIKTILKFQEGLASNIETVHFLTKFYLQIYTEHVVK